MELTDYETLLTITPSLLDGLDYDITILSNLSAALNEYIKDINWVGFYLYKDSMLKLGPFQGKVACTTIPLSKGVCGACASTLKTIRVDNVHEFKTHIACDSRSNSEICVPILVHGKLYGLLDIDSPSFNRFQSKDEEVLVKIIDMLEAVLEKIV